MLWKYSTHKPTLASSCARDRVLGIFCNSGPVVAVCGALGLMTHQEGEILVGGLSPREDGYLSAVWNTGSSLSTSSRGSGMD